MGLRDQVRQMGAARTAVGVGLMVAPSLALKGWLGDDAERGGVKALGRAMGVRDAVIGLLTLEAIDDPARLRRMLQLGIACDAVDATATLLAARSLPTKNVAFIGIMAGAAAVTGAYLLSQLDG